jgi:hypothetical protein
LIARWNRKIGTLVLPMAGVAMTSLVALDSASRGKKPPVDEDWVEIGIATDGTKAFVDRSSIVDAGSQVALWQRFIMEHAGHQQGPTVRVEQLVVYDCQARVVWTLESREMGAGGDMTRLQRFKPPVGDSVRPGTLPEYIHDSVC